MHVHPVSHTVSEVFPLLGIFHHLLAACSIVVIDRNFGADILFCNTESFLHTKLHRETVSVPAGFAHHLEALHGLEAADDVLNGASHHMVNTRHTVSRWRTFEKHK